MKVSPLILILAILFALPLLAEQAKSSSSRSVEIGLSVQLLHPDSLPEFDQKLTAFGPLVGIPIGGDVIQVQALYGSQDNASLYLIETDYRLRFHTPYFSGFALAGGHFLKHSQANYEAFGMNLGMGVSYLAVERVEIHLELKIYFQDRKLVTLGGGISYLL